MIKRDILEFISYSSIPRPYQKSEQLSLTTIHIHTKNSEAKTLNDFRAIALYNVLYSIIAKILVLGPQEILPNIISKRQGDFVKGIKAEIIIS